MNDLRNEVQILYDNYLYYTENRGISYGEILYIQNLKKEELINLYNELLEELDNRDLG
jgi:hypothetical protein